MNMGKLNRSQEAFISALLGLMQEKQYREITVSELAETAGYDRRTYYRYFQNKDDILYLYCASLLSDMTEIMMKKGSYTPESGFLSYFEFWDKHRDFLMLLEKHGLLYFLGEKLDNLLYDNVGQNVHSDLPEKLDENSEFSQFAYYFTLGGLWAALSFWIKTGMRQSPERLTQHILDSFTAMSGFINVSPDN